MASFRILSETEVKTELQSLPDWSVSDGKLTARFTFTDFKTAFSFITMVALESEVRNHHPAWSNAYNMVEFAFSTHDAGNKITDLDMEMAKYISQASAAFQK